MVFIKNLFFPYFGLDFSYDLKTLKNKNKHLSRKSNFYIFFNFFSRRKYIKNHFSDSTLFKVIDVLYNNQNKILNSRLLVRMNMIEKRFFTLKKNLLENRKNFLIIGSKFDKIKMERKKKFLNLFNDLSREINHVYKEITKTSKNPFGGTAFLDLSNKEQPYFGKIFLSSVFPGKNIKEITSLSGGEKTITSLSLFLAFAQILKIPIFFFDEIDLYLDLKFSKKIFEFLRKYSSRNKITIFMVTFKVNFILFFGMLFLVYKENSSSKIFSYTT
ncbi:P-loop containing nucleoside triphosphate hydrolase protein [Baffinella frigidus]|nr:P-loop containing nucleoside triphosphate hydrolase protein [Cryptophyta sp. CCMP2293]